MLICLPHIESHCYYSCYCCYNENDSAANGNIDEHLCYFGYGFRLEQDTLDVLKYGRTCKVFAKCCHITAQIGEHRRVQLFQVDTFHLDVGGVAFVMTLLLHLQFHRFYHLCYRWQILYNIYTNFIQKFYRTRFLFLLRFFSSACC